jgi:hypothetical protein
MRATVLITNVHNRVDRGNESSAMTHRTPKALRWKISAGKGGRTPATVSRGKDRQKDDFNGKVFLDVSTEMIAQFFERTDPL